jgi:hypothetical protein
MSMQPTPWRLVNDKIENIQIVDADDNVVLSQPRACWSSKWKTLADMHDLVGINSDDERAKWAKFIEVQLETLNGIVEAVNEEYAPAIQPGLA